MPSTHFQLETELAPAEWVQSRVVTFGEGVRSLIPDVYQAYARILHPAYLGMRPVRWETVAAATGTIMHRLAQFGNLTRIHQWDHRGPDQPSVWDRPPEEGNLPGSVWPPLVDLLRPHTTTPESCWFGAWEGWGDIRFPDEAPRFTLPARAYFLLSGPIEAIGDTVGGGSGAGTAALHQRYGLRSRRSETADTPPATNRYQSASLWWPEDRAWFVAAEIDLNSTYVGGSAALIEDILASEALEANPAYPDDPVDFSADTVNPAPDRRS